MPKTSPIITNFTSGEWSPRLAGRVDVQRYFNSAKALVNMIVFPHGGASRRFGTYYCGTVRNQNDYTRLVPFIISKSAAYVLEFGNYYVRAWSSDGTLIASTETSTTIPTSHLPVMKYAVDTEVLASVAGSPTMYLTDAVWTGKLQFNTPTSWSFATLSYLVKPTQFISNNSCAAIAIYEQRLFQASTPLQPAEIWGSESQYYTDYTTGTSDGNAVDFVVAPSQSGINQVHWMAGSRYLMLGTEGGCHIMTGSTGEDAITPSSIRVRPDTSVGADPLQGITIGKTIIYLQRAARKVRQLLYDIVSDSFQASDLTIMSEHITESGVRDWTFQFEPDSLLWAARNDGQFISLP